MSEMRPAIGPEIKRIVRQRCGFGCIICGSPIIDYDHIEEYHIVKKHEAENITLLCPNHHREKTLGRLPKEKVIKANENPYNLIKKEKGKSELYFYGNEISIVIGNITLKTKDTGDGGFLVPLIVYDEAPMFFKLNNDDISVNIRLKDKEDNIILLIEESELIVTNGVWDFEYVGKVLTIREKARKIFVEIEFLPPNTIYLKRTNIFCNGGQLSINQEKGITFNGKDLNMAFNRGVVNCQYGFIIHEEIRDYHGAFFLQVGK
ncbi:HNH endonuclease signature motif containing protein [Chryseobacterium contaminans]|uniref:HNH endonuclease signature motif containing protein n=1 Tax=Chryseobacterium contaminans TaxID=1423959 RepID=UPI003017336C